jgi:hypothetical protein
MKNLMSRKTWLFTLLGLLALFAGMSAAQGDLRDNPPDAPAQACDIAVRRSEPAQVEAGTETVITVYGNNFTDNTAVRLNGFGVLVTTTFPNNRELLTAVVPSSVPAGQYNVRVVDPACADNAINVPNPDRLVLNVNAPFQPLPTIEIPDPPTPIPGSPALLARNFVATPPNIPPGGTTTLTFEVVNTGNRTAEAIIASLDTGGSFVPAGGQSSVTLPNLFPGATASVSLTVVASGGAEPGPTTVPITLSFRDFTGENYTSNIALSVTIDRVTEVAQLILSSYSFNPDPMLPGGPVTVTVEVTNSGTDAAIQALLTLTGESNVLLAGPRGDRFPLGDIPPGGTVRLEVPMIVSSEAKAGPQTQPFRVSYFRLGEALEVTGGMTMNVAAVVQAAPVMLVDSYSVDLDPLSPGDTFALEVVLKNVGAVTAQGVLVTFGTVESSGGGGDDNNGGSGGSSTTPSNTFAPLGSGGTMFIGDVASQAETTFAQSFIVSGSATSGIYSLPITLRYQKPDGSSTQDNLRASIVVIVPPTLRVDLLNPVPEQVNIGEPLALSFELVNTGSRTLALTTGRAEAENGEVVEGAEQALGDVSANDVGAYTAVIIPSEEGEVTVTVRIGYRDDLNRERELVETYTALAVQPPPIIDPGPPIDFPLEPTPEPEAPSDILGRLLLGLLGLGS